MSLNYIKSKIRTVPHWPKQGVMFRDITTLLRDAKGFERVVDLLVERYKGKEIDAVAGIESRGFVTGAVLARELGVGFILIRKKGKLPAETVSEDYELEYGKATIEVHSDSVKESDRILLCDDLIATGGTALASCRLIEKLGGKVEECCFIVDLPELGGKKRLEEAGYDAFALVEFEGE
jgi:adenine phosphoribosyltransferase